MIVTLDSGSSIGNGDVNTVITCNNILIPRRVTSSVNNIAVKSTDTNNVIRDQDTSFSLDAVVPNVLGQTTKTIVHTTNKAGSVTSLVTTIRQFFNPLTGTDKIVISGFSSEYVFNQGGTTVCTVQSLSLIHI